MKIALGQTKVPCNDRRNARQGPEFITEAMGTSALAQEVDEVLALFLAELGLTATRMRFGVEPCLRMACHGIAPVSDRTG